jgi:hypothetical protein
VLDYPNSSSNEVSDYGGVLLACYGDNTLINKAGILEPAQKLNNTLSWANLHNLYHRHNRIFSVGTMNNVSTVFESSKRVKTQETFKVFLCCQDLDVLEPTNLIKSTVGWGKILNFSFDIENSVAEIDLNHNF